MGRHTLEGSRPGAAAAACWLAHRAVPLSQKGHGKVLAASILATRELYGALEARSNGQQAVKIAFINKPHTNMICYIPYHVESRDLAEARAVCGTVAAKLSPAHHRDFMVVQTTVRIKATEEWMADRFVPFCAQRFLRALGVTTDIELPVLRSVVMGPLALGATTELDSNGDSGALRFVRRASGRPHGKCFPGSHGDRFVTAFQGRLSQAGRTGEPTFEGTTPIGWYE